MSSRNIFIASISSDIGRSLAGHFTRKGDAVAGSYRTTPDASIAAAGPLVRCDVNSKADVERLRAALQAAKFTWDVFVSAVGVLEPIGPFFDLDFDDWERSVVTNSTAQLRVLHALHGLRRKPGPAQVVFFAGGGTNNAFDNFSAYCVGKILLIKMCELLDSECPDLHVSIVGTGWVRTKIHSQTLAAGKRSGANLQRTRELLESKTAGTPLEDVAQCIEWCLSAPKAAASGRNFSVVDDPWRGGDRLVASLKSDPNMYKLRRTGKTPGRK